MTTLTRRRISTTIAYVFLVVAALASVFPVVWAAVTSFKPSIDITSSEPVWRFAPTTNSYRALFTPFAPFDFVLLARNSIIVSLVTTLITVIVSISAAYALSRFHMRAKRTITFGIIATRMLPPIATSVPLFLLVNRLGLLDTQIALILTYTAINIPFAVLMLRGFIDEIPRSLDEAARVDGCSQLQVLLKVVLPLSRPGIVATAVFTFLQAWNEFALALVLTNRNASTLPLIVMSFTTDQGILWGPMASATILVIVVPIVLVFAAQRHLGRGLTMGAVKE